ncbi:HDOD domain-containing protein [Limnobacter humi]|uniref:HDOD domain-containing protein n=1 Tax=Limnobacter humi TaxID=1778671 RepID=A0ABT1WF96_9BURK|nr:HDOD domain-containing protein [Limnobacter humi]MCQ8896188.1 HDOD domain-containing protein [Limnobacter humi]
MSTKLQTILQAACSLPSIPRAVQEVLGLLEKPDLTIGELAEALSHDPVMSAKVLRLANSAYFGVQREVDTVESAALMIGIDSIRTMVLASGMMDTFKDMARFDRQRFWTISLLSAYIARDLANSVGLNGNKAYTASLIHGLGVLAIHKALPDLADQIDQNCKDECPYDRADVENALLGFHHGEVSAEIAKGWKLPEDIGESIRQYPHPRRTGPYSLSSIVHLSVALAMDLTDDMPEELWVDNLDSSVEELLSTTLDNLKTLRPRFDKSREFVEMLVTTH